MGLLPGSPLLSSLKQCVVSLAGNCGVLASVQYAAQRVLESGWCYLLPTVSERASALSELLPSGDAIHQEEVIPEGKQFMVDLLVSSLMADRSLEKALIAAIDVDSHEPSSPSGTKDEQAFPLLHLVQQLITNSTNKQLIYFNQVRLSLS